MFRSILKQTFKLNFKPKHTIPVPRITKRFSANSALMVIRQPNEKYKNKNPNIHIKILTALGGIGAFGAGYMWEKMNEKKIIEAKELAEKNEIQRQKAMEEQNEIDRINNEKIQNELLFKQLISDLEECSTAIELETVLHGKNLNSIVNNTSQLTSIFAIIFKRESKPNLEERKYLMSFFGDLLKKHIQTINDLNQICYRLHSKDILNCLFPLIIDNIPIALNSFTALSNFIAKTNIDNHLAELLEKIPQEHFKKMIFDTEPSCSHSPLTKLIHLHSVGVDYSSYFRESEIKSRINLFRNTIKKFSDTQLAQLCHDPEIRVHSSHRKYFRDYYEILFCYTISKCTDVQLRQLCNDPDNLEKLLFHVENVGEVLNRLGDQHVRELKLNQLPQLKKEAIFGLFPDKYKSLFQENSLVARL